MIDPIAGRHEATPQQLALAWQLRRTPACLPIPGTTSIEHVKENLASAAIPLTRSEVDTISGLTPEA